MGSETTEKINSDDFKTTSCSLVESINLMVDKQRVNVMCPHTLHSGLLDYDVPAAGIHNLTYCVLNYITI